MAYESQTYYTQNIIKLTKAQYDSLKNGESVKGYTLNSKDTLVLDIDSLYNDIPTKVSQLTNDSGFITSSALPTVNNATLTIQKNGTNVATFTANSSTNTTANITVPTKVSELTNDSGFLKNSDKITTSNLTEPNVVNGVTLTSQGIIDTTSADRLAFLQADQIIVEKSTDGGTTWEDAGYTDAQKRRIFLNKDNGGSYFAIPLKNNKKSCSCMLRVTITGMKYNVPDGTAETEKYNYWNSTYVKSTNRYFNPNLCTLWLSSNSDCIQLTIQMATGANSNNWITHGTYNKLYGWSGRSVCKLSGATLGGYTSQTANYWNWRFIFRTQASDGSLDDSKLSTSNTTNIQPIFNIRLFSSNAWENSNNMMGNGHLYDWDVDQNAIFPASIIANNVLPKSNNSYYLGLSNNQWLNAYIKNIYENGTLLSNKYAAKSHTHDDRYYTETEINTKLSGKSDTGHTHSVATTSANGFMSSTDKSKLDGIASGANKYTHPTYTSKASGLYKVTVDGTGHVSAATAVSKADITALGIPGQDTTYTTFGGAVSGSGSVGLVPAPQSNQGGYFLKGNGGWAALTKADVTGALGYTPPTTNTTYSTATSTTAGLVKIGYTTSGKNYAVQLSDGKMYVNVPWTDNNTTYSPATTTANGLMTSTDKSKLDGIASGANKYTHPAGNAASKSSGLYKFSTDSTSHINSVTAVSKADITALGIPGSDTTYSTATSTTAGLVKIGYTTSGKNYAVQLSDGKMYVNVPWTDNNTTYSAVTASRDGLMTSTDKSKLDGIASGATKVTTDTVSGWGYTKNAGTVTGVKVGSTSYSPSSGVVSLPAYPTSMAWNSITGKPSSYTPASHNQASNTITAMTGYSKPSSTSAIATSDSLNAAIGKLEKALDSKGTSNLTIGNTSTTAAAGNHTHSVATTSANGFMSSAMVTQLNQATSDLSTLSQTVDTLDSDVSAVEGEITNIKNNYEKKKTTTTIFNTLTSLTTNGTAVGVFTSKSITLTDSVQAGDRLKVYLRGNSGYEQYCAGIIEFELYAPTSSKLVGSGMIMPTIGDQKFIVSASITSTTSTSTSLSIVVYTLSKTSGAPAGANNVNVLKVERIR